MVDITICFSINTMLFAFAISSASMFENKIFVSTKGN